MKPILKINIIEHNFLPKWIFKESEYCYLLSSRYIDQLFQKNEKCVILAISCILLHVLITLKLYFMKKLISVLKNEELS